MNTAQILKVAEKYECLLRDTGSISKKYDTSLNIKPGDYRTFEHGIWMCEEVQSMATLDPEKAIRWLCFVQGILWASGLTSIDLMREDNRLLLGKSALNPI